MLLTLSFDPTHDTPEVMSRYGSVVNHKQSGADWLFLTTENRDKLAPLLDRFGPQVDRAKPGSATGPFQRRYFGELNKPEAMQALQRLYEVMSRKKPVTLLFASTNLERNNAGAFEGNGGRSVQTTDGHRAGAFGSQSCHPQALTWEMILYPVDR